MNLIQKIILDPNNRDVLSVVKGFRNGMVYGAKIRFPHALVMAFLFKSGSLSNKIKFILSATKEHSMKLAFFATIYKTLRILQRRLFKQKDDTIATFVSGFVGGYFVFHSNTPINNQISLYLFSRIAISVFKKFWHESGLPIPKNGFALFSALCWGCVMVLHANDAKYLQEGLKSSMDYIYLNSDTWDSLRTLLWHNK
ncbi:hypothetical protein BB559_000865 [Furculomyces boomerangus]|uniref:Peroxisomal membrane protein 4 n=2 Tax=Harpellales TaxID=61421 RepID=A0A2T9Z3Y6_9FUNG|nr:hypothetical protein BB559_000865 [Furculomyces boomerangus]PVZ98992.1 hypothetical protein BB558_005003 [Smittium angustum]